MSLCMQKRAAASELAAVTKAMANEHRICLLVHLACGEQSAKALAERSGFSIAKTSLHLKQLKLAGLVSQKRHAEFAVFQLSDNRVLTILDAAYKTIGGNFDETGNLLLSYMRRRKRPTHLSRQALAT